MLQALTMETTITYKKYKATATPYPTTSIPGYIQLLKDNKDHIYNGGTGVYLAREIEWGSQKLYFFFIDVDGDPKLKVAEEKTESAITNTRLTYYILKDLNADQFFTIIATGGEGFRFVSNKLVNKSVHNAFVEFMKNELPHIHDQGPTKDIEMPHQLFTYKGHMNHTNKDLVDRHAVVVPKTMLESGSFTVEDYYQLTAGKLDPDIVIDFMKKFLDFRPIIDPKSLNEFGKKLIEYETYVSEIKISPFKYLKFIKTHEAYSLDVMLRMLKGQGIPAVKAKRGEVEAISFHGLRCPACHDPKTNAVAYPPSYTLKCFNTDCHAHWDKGGLPLSKWSGIGSNQNLDTESDNTAPIIKLPTEFHNVEEARKRITNALETEEDSLIIATPGTGKTHTTIEDVANKMTGKRVIFSSFNKDLQRESYGKTLQLTPKEDHGRFCRIESMETACKQPEKLKSITSVGFSPAEIICRSCEYRKNDECSYYNQFEDMDHDVFFTTHHMLQYSQKRIKEVDLIIMDENLKSGLFLEDNCDDRDMRNLSSILDGLNRKLIDKILELGFGIARELKINKERPVIINGRKIASSDQHEETIIEILSKIMDISESDLKERLQKVIDAINQHTESQLYKKGVNLKAVNWINNLFNAKTYSYLLITEKNDLKFGYKYITPLGYEGVPIKVLDGTGNSRVANALTQRDFNEVNADVEWNSNRVHIINNTYRTTMHFSKDKDLKNLLNIMLEKTSAEKVMILTYKFIEPRITKICREIDSSKEYMGYHFFGPRGVNKFEEYDAVLVIGTPYANLDDAGQDAFILFPDKENEDLRNAWTRINMEWELIQGIHRIRPVKKESVDIIIAAKNWPSLLPPPNEKIDKSRERNQVELAITTLEPFVEELGFLNPDIGYIANVFVKSKVDIAKEFQRKISQILNTYNSDQVYDTTSIFCGGEWDSPL